MIMRDPHSKIWISGPCNLYAQNFPACYPVDSLVCKQTKRMTFVRLAMYSHKEKCKTVTVQVGFSEWSCYRIEFKIGLFSSFYVISALSELRESKWKTETITSILNYIIVNRNSPQSEYKITRTCASTSLAFAPPSDLFIPIQFLFHDWLFHSKYRIFLYSRMHHLLLFVISFALSSSAQGYPHESNNWKTIRCHQIRINFRRGYLWMPVQAEKQTCVWSLQAVHYGRIGQDVHFNLREWIRFGGQSFLNLPTNDTIVQSNFRIVWKFHKNTMSELRELRWVHQWTEVARFVFSQIF